MPSFLNPRKQRQKQEQEKRELQAKKDREARALAALAEELGWDDPSRRESDVGTLGGSTLVGSIEHYEPVPEEDLEQRQPSVDRFTTIEQMAAARWRAHTPELLERPEVQPVARPRSIRFASNTHAVPGVHATATATVASTAGDVAERDTGDVEL